MMIHEVRDGLLLPIVLGIYKLAIYFVLLAYSTLLWFIYKHLETLTRLWLHAQKEIISLQT